MMRVVALVAVLVAPHVITWRFAAGLPLAASQQDRFIVTGTLHIGLLTGLAGVLLISVAGATVIDLSLLALGAT
jgi:hypothetical protein